MSVKRRVLVTGSSGAIGRAVTAALLGAGHEVVALSRSMRGESDERSPALEHVLGDVLDHEDLRPLIAGTDVVCHLAAFIPPDLDDAAHASSCFEINSLATLHLASIACQLKKRFIYSSTGAVYVPSGAPATETSLAYPAARAPYYLGSKLLGEIYVEHLRLSQGLDSVIFRLGSAYGSGVRRSVVTQFVSNAISGKPLTVLYGGRACADFVYTGDLARLFLAAAQGKQRGIFNAGSGTATSILTLAEAVREVYAECIPVIEHVKTEETGSPGFSALSMERTNQAFDHKPVSVREGLRLMKEEQSGNASSVG